MLAQQHFYVPPHTRGGKFLFNVKQHDALKKQRYIFYEN